MCKVCIDSYISDPTLFISNSSTGYSNLWILQPAITTNTSDTTTSVKFPRGSTGYMKIVPGTSNTTITSSLPTTFDGKGWRTNGALSGTIYNGTWTIFLTLITGSNTTGNINVYIRLWKSANPDGSSATALTNWTQIYSISSPSANTTYRINGSMSLGDIQFSNEYLFVEFALGTTSACGKQTGCVITFESNTYNDRIETPNASISGLYSVESVSDVVSDTLATDTLTTTALYYIESVPDVISDTSATGTLTTTVKIQTKTELEVIPL